jgi:hypothetical protein
LAKALYGMLFMVIVPLALAAWAHGAANTVHLPALHSVFRGAMLAALGVGIMALGMLSLWI